MPGVDVPQGRVDSVPSTLRGGPSTLLTAPPIPCANYRAELQTPRGAGRAETGRLQAPDWRTRVSRSHEFPDSGGRGVLDSGTAGISRESQSQTHSLLMFCQTEQNLQKKRKKWIIDMYLNV